MNQRAARSLLDVHPWLVRAVSEHTTELLDGLKDGGNGLGARIKGVADTEGDRMRNAYQQGELVDFVDPDNATADFTIEDSNGLERAYFDATNVPAPLKPLAALVERWTNVIAAWTESSTDADLQRVRRE